MHLDISIIMLTILLPSSQLATTPAFSIAFFSGVHPSYNTYELSARIVNLYEGILQPYLFREFWKPIAYSNREQGL